MIVAGKYLCGDEEFGIVTQTVMAFRTIVSGSDDHYLLQGRIGYIYIYIENVYLGVSR